VDQEKLKKIFFGRCHTKSFYTYTTALLCFPEKLIPWWDSNPGLLVPEADAMSTPPGQPKTYFVKNNA
jgi:hypothetical protein